MSEIKNIFKEARNWAIEMYGLKIIKIRLNMAIRKAEMLCYINNTPYYVIPKPPRLKKGRRDYVIPVCRDDVNLGRKTGSIDKNIQHLELSKLAFYRTPINRNGKDAPTMKERAEMRDRYMRYQRLTNPILRLLNK